MQNVQSFAELNAFIADKWQGRRVKVLPYSYPIDIPAFAAGSSTVVTQKINGNADFVLVGLMTDTTTPAQMTLQINDATSQENLFNTPAGLDTVSQTLAATKDVSLGGYRRLAANSNQVLTLTSNAGGAIDAFTLVMYGVQVFPY